MARDVATFVCIPLGGVALTDSGVNASPRIKQAVHSLLTEEPLQSALYPQNVGAVVIVA